MNQIFPQKIEFSFAITKAFTTSLRFLYKRFVVRSFLPRSSFIALLTSRVAIFFRSLVFNYLPEKYSFDILNITGLNKTSAIRFGRAINPFITSATSHIKLILSLACPPRFSA